MIGSAVSKVGYIRRHTAILPLNFLSSFSSYSVDKLLQTVIGRSQQR